MGTRRISLQWEEKIPTLDIGKPVEFSLPRLIPRDVDRAWGQIVLAKAETIDIQLPQGVMSLSPRQDLTMVVHGADGTREVTVMSRLDTDNEIAYFQSGGILQYVLNNLVQRSQ